MSGSVGVRCRWAEVIPELVGRNITRASRTCKCLKAHKVVRLCSWAVLWTHATLRFVAVLGLSEIVMFVVGMSKIVLFTGWTRSRGIHSCKWEDNIERDRREVRFERMRVIHGGNSSWTWRYTVTCRKRWLISSPSDQIIASLAKDPATVN